MPKYDLDYPPPRRKPHAEHKRDSRILVRLPWEMLGQFRNTCYRRQRHMADVLREFMREYVDAPDE